MTHDPIEDRFEERLLAEDIAGNPPASSAGPTEAAGLGAKGQNGPAMPSESDAELDELVELTRQLGDLPGLPADSRAALKSDLIRMAETSYPATVPASRGRPPLPLVLLLLLALLLAGAAVSLGRSSNDGAGSFFIANEDDLAPTATLHANRPNSPSPDAMNDVRASIDQETGPTTSAARPLSPPTATGAPIATASPTVPALGGPLNSGRSGPSGATPAKQGPGRIRGLVRAVGGTPLEGALVTAISLDGLGATSATTGGDGRFDFGLPSGSYVIRAEAADHRGQWFDHTAERASATTIYVEAGRTVLDIRFDLKPEPDSDDDPEEPTPAATDEGYPGPTSPPPDSPTDEPYPPPAYP